MARFAPATAIAAVIGADPAGTASPPGTRGNRKRRAKPRRAAIERYFASSPSCRLEIAAMLTKASAPLARFVCSASMPGRTPNHRRINQHPSRSTSARRRGTKAHRGRLRACWLFAEREFRSPSRPTHKGRGDKPRRRRRYNRPRRRDSPSEPFAEETTAHANARERSRHGRRSATPLAPEAETHAVNPPACRGSRSRASVAAIVAPFSGASQNRAASRSARSIDWSISGLFSAQSRRTANTFSGPFRQMSCEVATVVASPSRHAISPQGAPAQKPSIRSSRSAWTTPTGGITVRDTSRSGSMPRAASQ